MMKSLLIRFPTLLLLGCLFLLVACTREQPTHTIRFYPETVATGDAFSRLIEMPMSGLEFIVSRRPVIWEEQIERVDMVQVESGEYALRFVLDDVGTRELYRQSVEKNGLRMITVINDKPLGVRQLDGPLADGVYFTFMEMPADQLIELTAQLQKNLKIIQNNKKSFFW